MIWKIITIYTVITFLMINCVSENNDDGGDLEYKIYTKEMISIKDVISYLKPKKEIKTLKFLILFIFTYPSIFILILNSLITLLWNVYYYIQIKTFPYKKKYEPIYIDKDFFIIHSHITWARLFKLILIQIPRIRGYHNAYSIIKNANNPKKIKYIIAHALNNLKNILILSISPLRLYSLIDLTLYSYRNIENEFYVYNIKKYIYYQFYIYNSEIINNTKKMKVLKNEKKELIFNPFNNNNNKKFEKIAWNIMKNEMTSSDSKGGIHWSIYNESYIDNKSVIGQLTGKTPEGAKNEAKSIKINAKNYKKENMNVITNILVPNENLQKNYNSKIILNTCSGNIAGWRHLNLLITNQRYFNRGWLIEESDNSYNFNSIDLGNRNIFENIVNYGGALENRRRAELILNFYATLNEDQMYYLLDMNRSPQIYDLHTWENTDEIREILSRPDIDVLLNNN